MPRGARGQDAIRSNSSVVVEPAWVVIRFSTGGRAKESKGTTHNTWQVSIKEIKKS